MAHRTIPPNDEEERYWEGYLAVMARMLVFGNYFPFSCFYFKIYIWIWDSIIYGVRDSSGAYLSIATHSINIAR